MGVGVGAEDRTGALDDDDTQARALEPPPAAALGDGSGEEPPFSDEDRARLVFQLAKAEIRVWEKETVFKYMAKKVRSASRFRFLFHSRSFPPSLFCLVRSLLASRRDS